jgi:hypothetical protein
MVRSIDLFESLGKSSPLLARELEAWVVNSVKVKMIKKYESLLEFDGRQNLRKLFLVPVFKISELNKRVEETAPEMKTLYFRELSAIMNEAEEKIE